MSDGILSGLVRHPGVRYPTVLVDLDDVREALRSALDPDDLSVVSEITTAIIGSCDAREGDMSCAHGEQINWARSQEAGTDPHCDAWHAEADGVRFVVSALRVRLAGGDQ